MNKKTFVKVVNSFYCWHRWKDALNEVAFLRQMHPHEFQVEVKIQVLENNRSIEFYMLKHELDKILGEMQNKKVENSCEDFCDLVYSKLIKIYGKNREYVIKVEEDQGYGAEVKYKL